MRNEFSPTWYSVFLDPIPAQHTGTETAFVLRHLPLPSFRSLLDLCCGPGRHAVHLAEHGYHILGIDKNAAAIARAQQSAAPRARFMVHDMRDLDTIPENFDGILNLWHSFGYFDDTTNIEILRQIHSKLREGGRFILDLYNRENLERFPARMQFEREGIQIVAEYRWSGKRVTCSLRYGEATVSDRFEWHIYTPDEILERTAALGLRCLVACAWFDEQLAPSSEHTRMQFVFEREL